MLLPRGALGGRVTKAFSDAWRPAGDATVLEQRFGSSAELKQSINSGTGIPPTGTPVVVREAPANAAVTIADLTIPHCRITAQCRCPPMPTAYRRGLYYRHPRRAGAD